MTATKQDGLFALTQLTETEFNLILGIVGTANRRCFQERDDDGNWYSGDDFVLSLDDDQRTALAKLGGEIEKMY